MSRRYSYSGATFIASTVTDATNAEQLVITLADDVVAPIAADQKVYVTYSGSDLDDAAGNQVTQFTKVVDVSALTSTTLVNCVTWLPAASSRSLPL